MAKINEVIKTGANAITIVAASYRLVKISYPYEARIGKIVVKQVAVADGGGTAVAFSIDLLNSKMTLATDTDIANATALPNNIELFKIMDTKTAIAGSTIKDFTPEVGGDGFLFRNFDGTSAVPKRELYMLIRPSGAVGTTKWEFALCGVTDIG